MTQKECKHPCCGETCRKKKDKPKKVYTLKRTPLKKKPYTIKKISDKQKGRLVIYKQLAAKFKKENPECLARLSGCTIKTNDVHHMAGREGDRLNDVAYWLPVCRNCHSFITENSNWAIQNGLSQKRVT